MKPLVTVLIDTYNYGRFLEEAIDSVLAQDYPNDKFEILVVDDGSIDDTAERVRSYGTRIEYLYKPNGGQASAFNFGFERARGDIIAFLDADDYWLPGKLSRVADTFEQNPGVGLVYHKQTDLNSETGSFTEGNFAQCSGFLPDDLKAILDYRVLPTSSLTFSRAALGRMMPMPDWIKLQADAYLALLVVFLAPVLGVPEILSVYRVHGKNLHAANAHNAGQQYERLSLRKAIFKAVAEWLKDHNCDLQRTDIKMFFEQLVLFVASEEFDLQAPTRAEFYKYMKRYTKLYWTEDCWKLRVMNVVNTVMAPLVGYHKFSTMYKAELRVIDFLLRHTARQT